MFFCPPQKKSLIRFKGDSILGLDDWFLVSNAPFVEWWQLKDFFIFTPNYLGFHDPILTTAHIFSNGLVGSTTNVGKRSGRSTQRVPPHFSHHRPRSVSIAPSAKVSDAVLGLERQMPKGWKFHGGRWWWMRLHIDQYEPTTNFPIWRYPNIHIPNNQFPTYKHSIWGTPSISPIWRVVVTP